MRIFLSLCFFQCIMVTALFAQKEEIWRPGPSYGHGIDSLQKDSILVYQVGELNYIQEERITILDEYMKSHPLKHEGYRIQLVFGSRDEVASAKSKFLVRWNYSAYESYLQPNFRLRIGDFMSKQEAEKLLSELKPHFTGAYVVQDKIEVPRQFK